MPTSAPPSSSPPTTVPVPLQSLLSRTRNVNGPPPDSVVSSRVACLNPAHAIRLSANVLDAVYISVPPSSPCRPAVVTVAHVWPLYAVDDGYVALDLWTLKALKLDAATLPASCPIASSQSRRSHNNSSSVQSTPPSRRGRRKRKGSLNPASPSVVPSPSSQPSPSPSPSPESTAPVVSVKLVNTTDLCIARSVRVKSVPDAVLATMLTSSDPLFEDSLHARLHGRIVLPGMYVSVPLLGVSSEFLITGVDTKINVEESEDSLCARRVGDSTQVVLDDAKSDNRAGGTSTKSEIPLLERLGGIHDQLSVLKPFLRDALQLVDHDAGKTSTDENHQNVNNNTDTKHTVAKGALLHGPMGSGKTTIAIAIAKWTGAHIEVIPCASLFASSDPSTSAASALQTAFARVKRRAPGIVILDDVDAVAPKRDSPNADATRIRVLATLLKLLDDLGPRSRCAVLATTIHCDNLDPAMRRPGRLDIELEIGIPSPLQRADMLLALARHSGMSLSDDDAKTAAAVGHGHVAADLASAWRMAIANSPCTANSSDTSTANKSLITARELVNAVRAVRPSALREVWVEVPTTRWSDVGGKEDAKQRLREAVEWPVSRGRLLQRLGIRPPTGVLLFGPPGCSKTLLARAVATECGANFISVKGAELLSKYVGDSEKAVRKTFERARAAAPCVIFFDEVDALASERSASAPGSGVHSRVVAQLLHEMDGIDHVHDDVVGSAQKRVVVIAATNRPDCLDSAFMRAGRIDVQVYVGLPDRTERLDILRVHTRKTPLARDVDLETLADDQYTGSFSGAEIAALVREAGLCAMERDVAHVEAIGKIDFDAALRKIRPRTSQQTMRYFEQYVRQLEEKRPY